MMAPGAAVNPLAALVLQRLMELGEPGRPLGLHEASLRSGGMVSTETIRAIARGEHAGPISDQVLVGLAEGLDIPIGTILDAAHG